VGKKPPALFRKNGCVYIIPAFIHASMVGLVSCQTKTPLSVTRYGVCVCITHVALAEIDWCSDASDAYVQWSDNRSRSWCSEILLL